MITYIVQFIVGLGTCYLLYLFFLRREKSFVFNRFYLLGSVFLCLTVPLLEVQTPQAMPFIADMNLAEIIAENEPIKESLTGVTVEKLEKGTDFARVFFWSIYLTITFLLVLRFSRNLYHIRKHLDKRGSEINGLQIILLQEKTDPFSFFRYLFVNKDKFEEGQLTQSIIEHEQAHSQQWHTLDILFIELIGCFFWMNPFVWLYKKVISENHEYLADNRVVKKGLDTEDYSNKIIQSVNNLHPLSLTSGFSYVQTKNRLIMLNKTASSLFVRIFKLTSVLLLLGMILTLNAFDYNSDKTPFVVVVDAGHGGKDNGVAEGQLFEKELNLNICKRLEALSKQDRKIKVLLTRTTDEFMTLDERINFVNDQKADLLISIHCNQAKNKGKNGVEAYYYQSGKFETTSYAYSKTLIAEQLKTVSDQGAIKTADFFILKNSNCPGIAIELGFLSNENDRAKLKNPKHQHQIATSIYNGLIKIKEDRS